MQFLIFLSDFMVPAVIFAIVFYGFLKKIPVFDVFTRGVKKGFTTVFYIAPSLIGLMSAVSALRGSGILDQMEKLLKPLACLLRFPAELIPLSLIHI